jgi:hypothetical protein
MAVSGHWRGQLAFVYGLVAIVQLDTFFMAVSGHWTGQLAFVYGLVAIVQLDTFLWQLVDIGVDN